MRQRLISPFRTNRQSPQARDLVAHWGDGVGSTIKDVLGRGRSFNGVAAGDARLGWTPWGTRSFEFDGTGDYFNIGMLQGIKLPITAGSACTGITTDGTYLYVADAFNGQIVKINNGGDEVSRITVTFTQSIQGLTYVPTVTGSGVAGFIYGDSGSTALRCVDTAGVQLWAKTVAGTNSNACSYESGRDSVWTCAANATACHRYDMATRTLQETVTLASVTNLDGILYDSVLDCLWSLDDAGSFTAATVRRHNKGTGAVVSSFTGPGDGEHMVLDPVDTTKMWITSDREYHSAIRNGNRMWLYDKTGVLQDMNDGVFSGALNACGIICSFRPDTVSPANQTIIDGFPMAGSNFSFAMATSGLNSSVSTAGNSLSSSTGILTAGLWNRGSGMAYDGTTLKIYHRGQMVTSAARTKNNRPDFAVTVGGRLTGNGSSPASATLTLPFTGGIADLRLFSRAPTDAEFMAAANGVDDIYFAKKSRPLRAALGGGGGGAGAERAAVQHLRNLGVY